MLSLVVVVVVGSVFGQSHESAEALLKSFQSTGTDGKVALLRRLHAVPTAAGVPVYFAALDYSVDHEQDALYDSRINEVGRLAIESLSKLPVTDGVDTVWRYFTAQTSDELRIYALRVIRSSAGNVPDDVAVALSDYLSRMNHMSKSGVRPNGELIETTVAALTDIGHPSAFTSLFDAAMHPNYGVGLRDRAAGGLSRLDVEVERELVELLSRATLDEYQAVLEFSKKTSSLSSKTKEAIARITLENTMDSRYRDQSDAQRAKDLRHAAAVELAQLQALSPPELILAYLDSVYSEYRRNETTLAYAVEAVAMVGDTGSAKAVLRLTTLLESFNTMVEYDSSVEDQLVIAVIEQLGRLNDDAAADTLLQTQLLDYPRDIRELARDVEVRLRRGTL